MCIGSTQGRSRSRPGHSRVALLSQRVLQAVLGVLDDVFDLVALANSDQLGVTDSVAGNFLDGTVGLLGRAGDTILVHVAVSPIVDAISAAGGRGSSTSAIHIQVSAHRTSGSPTTRAEKAVERHRRIDCVTGDLVDHDVINAAELFPSELVPFISSAVMRDPEAIEAVSAMVKVLNRYKGFARFQTGKPRLGGDALFERFTFYDIRQRFCEYRLGNYSALSCSPENRRPGWAPPGILDTNTICAIAAICPIVTGARYLNAESKRLIR
jgi:hypothetical protein